MIFLLIDSAMHDPDVHPIVSGGIDRAARFIDDFPAWSGEDNGNLEQSRQSGSALASAESTGRTHSPMRLWYWSTILAVAVACLGLLKMMRAVTFRNRSADHLPERSADPVPPDSVP